jgi:hypothetical protein
VLIPLLRDGRGRVRARFGVNVDIGCLRRCSFIDGSDYCFGVIRALCESPHGPLTRDVGLLAGTFSFVESFLLEIKAVVAQNRSAEVLLISIDRSAFRIVLHGVRKEPLAF